MNLKRKIILKRIITFIMGIACLCVGFLKNAQQLISMGMAIAFFSAVRGLMQWKMLSNPSKMKEFENTCKDERVMFIARKSYSFAFWTSVYAEFAGVLAAMYFGMNDLAEVLSVIVYLQVLIYVASNIYYNRKY